jgi:hypothetical protein
MVPVQVDSHWEPLLGPMSKQHTCPLAHWLELSHARKKPLVAQAVCCMHVPPAPPWTQQPCPAAMSHDVDPQGTVAGPASVDDEASTWSGTATTSLASLGLLPSLGATSPSLEPPSQLRHAPPSSPPQPEKSEHDASKTVVDAMAAWRRVTTEC